MPKTLAALPSNQYATLLELVFGQLLDLAPLAAAAAMSEWTAALTLVDVDVDVAAAVDCQRTARSMEEGANEGSGGQGRTCGALAQGRQANSRRVRRGAAVRSCGKAWKTEAMTAEGVVLVDGEARKAAAGLLFQWFDRRARLLRVRVRVRGTRPDAAERGARILARHDWAAHARDDPPSLSRPQLTRARNDASNASC
jgi:hypothetical protein